MLTSILSPTCTVSWPVASRNWSTGTTPSILRPMSTKTESAEIETTVPSMASPRAAPWCCCSNSERMSANELSSEGAAVSFRVEGGTPGSAGDVGLSMRGSCKTIVSQSGVVGSSSARTITPKDRRQNRQKWEDVRKRNSVPLPRFKQNMVKMVWVVPGLQRIGLSGS